MSHKHACMHAKKTRRLLSGGLSLPLRWDVLAVHPVRQPALAERLGLWLKKVTAWGPNASDRLGLEHKASNQQARPGAQKRPAGSAWSTKASNRLELEHNRSLWLKIVLQQAQGKNNVPKARCERPEGTRCKEQSPKHDGIKMPPKRRAT